VSSFYTQALEVYLDDSSKEGMVSFQYFSDEIEVMPLLLLWSSPLRLSGAVPESESTVLD
jgi:hypothetical protein